MSVASRPVSTGKTRTCPHCKATILESLSICPGCMHHLRFDSEAARRQVAAAPALQVEGIIRHPPLEQPLEYFVIIAIRNDRGEEVTRQVVNVGALQPSEKRTFTLSVEVLPPVAPPPVKSGASAGPATTGTPKAPAAPPPSAPNPSPQPAVAKGTATPAATSAPSTSTPGLPTPSKQPVSGLSPLAPTPPKPSGSAAAKPNEPAKPASGYVLKPPSPGGPKRH